MGHHRLRPCPRMPSEPCPLSHLWASYVVSDGHPCRVGALAYIDDRTLWLRKGRPVSCMWDALLRSAEFDRAFCFSLSLAKCALIPRVPSKEHSALAEAFGFKQAEELEVLGVRAPFDGAWTLLRLRVRKVVLRVRLLGWATANRKIQKQLLLSLVVPPFSWAAGFARPDAKALNEIRSAITQAFQKCFSRDFARAEAFGFKQAEELEVLGVRAPFDGAWTLLRLRVRKVVLRVRLLGWVTANRKIQKQLLLSLVVPLSLGLGRMPRL